MKYIYDISENNGYKENIKIGKKAQNLNDLLKNGFNVPYFFVISNEYFEKIIFSKINKSLNIYDWNDVINNNNSKNLLQKIKDIIEDHTFENEFLKELDSYLKNDEYYAVRSSSIEEDSDSFSFAGQFETFLYIKKEEVLQNIKKIWISSFSDHIMKYRKEQKINNKIVTANVDVKATYPQMSTDYTVKGSYENEKIKELALKQINLQTRCQDLYNERPDIADSMVNVLVNDYKRDVSLNYIFKEPMRAYSYFALFQYIVVGNQARLIFDPTRDASDNKVFGAVATSWDTYYPGSERTQNLHNITIKGIL